MMNRKLILFSAAFLLAGSAWAQNGSFRNTQEAVRYYEDLVGNLAQQVRSMQDENARLSASVQNLQRQLESIARSNELMTKDISELRKTISQNAENATDSFPISPQNSTPRHRFRSISRSRVPAVTGLLRITRSMLFRKAPL